MIYWRYLTAPGWPVFVAISLIFLLGSIFNLCVSGWIAFWTVGLIPCEPYHDSASALHFEVSREKISVSCYLTNIFFYSAILIVICVSYVLLCGLQWLLATLAAMHSSKVFHRQMVERLFQAPMSFFEATPMGRIINRASSDMLKMDFLLSVLVPVFGFYFFLLLVILFAITVFTPFFIFPMLIITALFYNLQSTYRATKREVQRLDSVKQSHVLARLGEGYQGALTIRAYGETNWFSAKMREAIDDNTRIHLVLIMTDKWLKARAGLITSLIILFVSLVDWIFFELWGDIVSVGTLAALTIVLTVQSSSYIDELFRQGAECESAMTGVERILSYADSIPQEAPRHQARDETLPAAWPVEGSLSFNDCVMSYRPELDPTLCHISFTIRAGEKVGIVGRTGAGKSSLLVALFRLVELAQGTIAIDGTDIAQLGLITLRSRLSIIPQDPVLYSGTVRYNLDPFEQHSDQELWDALELANMKSKIEKEPLQLLTAVSDGGSNFSGGERSLFALARCVLRQNKILVLDEATASVDLGTDALIQKAIRKRFATCTILTIAHRLHTIVDNDRILVMDGGKVAEFDTPANLLANPQGIFSEMVDALGPNESAKLRKIAKGELDFVASLETLEYENDNNNDEDAVRVPPQ